MGTVAIGAGIIAAAGTAYVAVVSTATLIAIGVATAAVTHLVIKELMPDVATNVKSNQDMTVGKPVPRIVVGDRSGQTRKKHTHAYSSPHTPLAGGP